MLSSLAIKARAINLPQKIKNATSKLQKKSGATNKKGISTFELLAILGVCIIIITVTFHVAKVPIENWWQASVMPLWDIRGTGGF